MVGNTINRVTTDFIVTANGALLHPREFEGCRATSFPGDRSHTYDVRNHPGTYS